MDTALEATVEILIFLTVLAPTAIVISWMFDGEG